MPHSHIASNTNRCLKVNLFILIYLLLRPQCSVVLKKKKKLYLSYIQVLLRAYRWACLINFPSIHSCQTFYLDSLIPFTILHGVIWKGKLLIQLAPWLLGPSLFSPSPPFVLFFHSLTCSHIQTTHTQTLETFHPFNLVISLFCK